MFTTTLGKPPKKQGKKIDYKKLLEDMYEKAGLTMERDLEHTEDTNQLQYHDQLLLQARTGGIK